MTFVSSIGIGSLLRHCLRWHYPTSLIFFTLHLLGGNWPLLKTAVVWSHSWGDCDDSSSYCHQLDHFGQWLRWQTFACFEQRWLQTPMSFIHFPRQLPNRQATYILLPIPSFYQARMTATLSLDYWLNNNLDYLLKIVCLEYYRNKKIDYFALNNQKPLRTRISRCVLLAIV